MDHDDKKDQTASKPRATEDKAVTSEITLQVDEKRNRTGTHEDLSRTRAR